MGKYNVKDQEDYLLEHNVLEETGDSCFFLTSIGDRRKGIYFIPSSRNTVRIAPIISSSSFLKPLASKLYKTIT